jgi:hypothetical protein
MSKIIIKDNRYAKLEEEDLVFLGKVNKLLSYKQEGVEYSPAYKNTGWDGITHIMNKKRELPLGLIPMVEEFYKENSKEITVEDARQPYIKNLPMNIYPKLKELGKIPRDYQEDVVNLVENTRRGIIRIVTGGGKSLVAALVASKLNKPTNIYVISLDLLSQFHTFFSSVFDEPIGMVGGGICKIERINIVSLWTAGRALDISDKDLFILDEASEKEDFDISNKHKIIKMLENAKVHILDESHVASTITLKNVYANIDPESLYGLSGTPFRQSEIDLLISGILGEKIVDINAERLINAGILVPPTIKFITVPSIYNTASNYQEMYKQYIVENPVRNALIVENTKKLVGKGYPTLALFKTIRHGEILFELMQEAGIKCAILSGKDALKYRNQIKKQLEDKEIDVILASTIFDIGLDLTTLSALVLCGSGKSNIRALQRIGRVIRSHPGKKRAIVVDFYDQTRWLKNHSKARYQIYKAEKGFDVLPLK